MTKTTIDPQEVAKFAKLADHWWNTSGPLKTLHDINPARLEFITTHCNVSGKRVLDIGCGGGILTESLAASGCLPSGIDAEPEAIAAAKRHAETQGLAIDYQCTPIELYESERFPLITCMEMLEHVQNPQEVINHCARLLAPGGFLLLSTINRTLKAYATAIIAAEYVMNLLPRQTHEYSKFIKPGELAQMVRAAGLEVTGLRGISYNPFSRTAGLQDDVSVNYLLSCFKP